ncbi:hypothetical protein N9R87_04170 [Flavobacteriaceae bacterium]|nr:hypothetical protein [Flavobacteriaceae bacterium]
MNHSEQLNLINDAINKTKEQLKPTSVNFIFWGILITLMSLIHYLFPEFIQKTTYSSLIFWTIIPVIGMVLTIVYNIKTGIRMGYETHIGRALKLVWSVFNVAWIVLIIMAFFKKQNPVQDILFLLGVILLISALLIRFKPLIIGGVCVIACSVLITLSPHINTFLINAIAAFVGLFCTWTFTLFKQKTCLSHSINY